MASFEDFGAPPAPKQLSTRDKKLQGTFSSIPPSDDRDDLTVSNFNELESQIARTKDPKARQILINEHNRLKGQLHLNDDRSLTQSKFRDFSEKGAPSPTMQSLKTMGGEAAAVGDFLWGFFSMPVGVGMDIGSRAYALGAGESRRIQAQAGREGSAWAAETFGNPFQKLVNLFDSGEAYDKAKTTQGMKWLSEKIDEYGKRIETATGGKVLKEDVASLVDTILVGAGTRGASLAKGEMKFKPREEPKVTDEMKARRPGTKEPGVSDAEIVSTEPKPAKTPLLPAGETGSIMDVRKDLNRFSDKDLAAIGMTREGMERELNLAVLPERMKFLTMTAGAAAAGIGGAALYQWWQENKDKNLPVPKEPEAEPRPNERGNLEAKRDLTPWLLGPGIAMAGAIKGPGGMWHPEAVERLASPLQDKLGRLSNGTHILDTHDAELRPEHKPLREWPVKAIRNYLNKYAGTERDPLKDVEIPHAQGTISWGDAWDSLIKGQKAKEYEGRQGIEGAKEEETIWHVAPRASQHANAAVGYLSHVGDYLRQNVKPEDLQRYDLVRAVKETAENDKRVAKQMEKAAASSMKDMPVYKAYPDGFKWVELKLPEKLTEEQAKQVREASKSEKKRLGEEYVPGEMPTDINPEDRIWIAIDSSGKPIENAYTGATAAAASPEEAWLAGRLAEEGNTMGHCVGGYCEGVASGDSRIFSLRDPKGKSHVTVEVQSSGKTRPRQLSSLKDIITGKMEDIVQIKGKQNRAPSKEYLPYVQDFVKSGKWGEVGDLGNTGLYRLDKPDAQGNYPRLPPADLSMFADHQKMQEAAIRLSKRGIEYASREDILKEAGIDPKDNLERSLGPKDQQGAMTVGDAAKLTALGIGAAAGAYLSQDNPWFGAAVGAGSVLAAFALRHPDNIIHKEVKQALASLRRDVHPAFYAGIEDRTKAKTGEAVIAKNISEKMQHDSAVYHASEGPRRFWEKHSKENQVAFIKALEEGRKFGDPTLAAMAERYKAWAEKMAADDKRMGIEYDPIDHYVPHSFEDSAGVADFLTRKYGVKWGDPGFTKGRDFNLFDEAIKAGFKPKSLNPETIFLNRQYASNIAEMRINVLEDLRQQGLARLKDEKRLETSSEVVRRAPNGKIYYVDPRAAQILHNAFDTPSLWSRKDALGAVFKGAMAVKNTLVPIVLNASLFHPLHLILGMDNSAAMLRSTKLLADRKISAGQHAFNLAWGFSVIGPMYDSIWRNPKAGWRPMQVWKGTVPEGKLTAADSEILQRTFEGGFIPEMGAEWKTKAVENFTNAVKHRSLSAIPQFLLAIPQWIQKPIFEYWIPALKYANYIKDTQAALQANPALFQDQAARMRAFRKIAKSVENRFGEMAYSTLFWNRFLRDVGVASELSLGWTLGFFREYGGGLREAGHGIVNLTKDGKVARGEMDRALFVMFYTANTMLYGGLLTWAMTGKPPNEWLDYFYPKTGDKKKDGTDARVNTMFYSREWLGMWKHMQNEGMLSGASQFMLNKVAPTWGISKGLWTNLDYFGKEISDPNAPAMKQLSQKLMWAMGETTPISIQSIKKMEDKSVKNIALSVAGFSPAPRYVTETPIEGKIASIYRQYHQSVTPYARARRSDDVRELYQHKQAGDEEAFRNKLDAMRQAYGLSHADATRLSRDANVPPTERMFKSLSIEQQRVLLNKMNSDERTRFLPFASRKLKREFEER